MKIWSSPPPLVLEKPDVESSLAKLLRSDTSGSIRGFSTNSSHSTFAQKKGDGERRKRPVSDHCPGSARTGAKRSRPSTGTIPRPGVLDGGGKPPNSGSVLMNLLVSGCDISAGYICLNARKPYARSYTPWS
ncbi:hypothetical protein J6590_015141 [Homalodisca vitripennis]|nr:hypothetical protein J6590_015141 [Homalodisca vitripennis]